MTHVPIEHIPCLMPWDADPSVATRPTHPTEIRHNIGKVLPPTASDANAPSSPTCTTPRKVSTNQPTNKQTKQATDHPTD